MTAVVLTGGRSRRLGEPKAWVAVGGEPCVARVFAACQEVCGARVCFQGYDPRLGARFPKTPVWSDPEPGEGPLAALVAALQAAQGDSVLLLACDLPFVSAALLRDVAAAVDAGADIAWPVDSDRAHPLCGAYGAGVVSAARALRAAGRRSLLALEEAPGLRVRRLAPRAAWGDLQRLFCNVNTPEELARARGMVTAVPPELAPAPRGDSP